jgi:GNAT superfamily N-acetyltransferase
MINLTNEEIRLTERAHYYMQLSAYFTELVDLPGVRFAFTNRLTDTWYNQAYDIDWDPDNSNELYKQIERVCVDRDRAPCLYLSPACRPSNLEEIVKKSGLVEFETEAWMFLPLDLDTSGIQKADILVEEVSLESNFDEFADVYRRGLPGDDVESYIESVRVGLRYAPPGVDVRYLLARVNGNQAGMLSILTVGECSGIYAVATLPEYQRRGVARALTFEASQIARRNRSSYFFLQTVVGDEGEQAFGRIGFETVFTRTGYTTAAEARSIAHG